MSEAIHLSLPAKPGLMSLVRFAAATLAAEADFSIDEIEDLKLAADEMCLSLVGGPELPVMLLELSRDGATGEEITITCRVALDAIPDADDDDPRGEWSFQILDALVDAHGRDVVGTDCQAWLRKRRNRSSGS